MRATAIIVKNNLILLIHRFRGGKEFFVLPGGGVEDNETIEEALIREIKEETNYDAKINRKLLERYNEFDDRIHHYFLITDFSGNLQLGGPELKINSDSDRYLLEWHRIDEINNLPLKPDVVKTEILSQIEL